MDFKIVHNNFNVANLDESLDFYNKALDLKEIRRIDKTDFTLVYLGNEKSLHLLELTYLKGHQQKYDLGENEFHLAFETEDFQKAYKHHKSMGCICFENKDMGIYFITDPDGYWLEILPSKKY